MVNDERDPLREVFTRQRQAEEAGAPPFSAFIAGARLRQRAALARRGLWFYGAVSAAAVVGVLAFSVRGFWGFGSGLEWDEPLGIGLSNVSWQAPTDFLLDTPGAEALRTVPRLMQVSDLGLVPLSALTLSDSHE